jgi:hypothetical protein
VLTLNIRRAGFRYEVAGMLLIRLQELARKIIGNGRPLQSLTMSLQGWQCNVPASMPHSKRIVLSQWPRFTCTEQHVRLIHLSYCKAIGLNKLPTQYAIDCYKLVVRIVMVTATGAKNAFGVRLYRLN